MSLRDHTDVEYHAVSPLSGVTQRGWFVVSGGQFIGGPFTREAEAVGRRRRWLVARGAKP